MNFHFCFIFRFCSKKSHLCWAENFMFATEPYLNSVISAQYVTFVFVFRPRKEFHFRRHFHLRPKMKSFSIILKSFSNRSFSIGLYIKLFQLTPYVSDFQTFNNCRFWTACRCLKQISFTLHFDTSLHHHHHRRRVFQVTAAPLRDPWRSQISTA